MRSTRSRSGSSRPENSGTSRGSRDSTCTTWNREQYRFFRSPSSSANITEEVVRLPNSSRTSVFGFASTVEAIDSIGVIPDPAAIIRCRPGSDGSARRLPDGTCTSTRSPGRTSWTSHDENIPPGISRTPIRGQPPAGEQIEYDRRCSTPSITRRSASDCPAANS